MHSRASVRSNQQLTALAKAAELPGDLEVPGHPEITTGYTEIYLGLWKRPDGRQVEVAVKELKRLFPRSRRSDPNALQQKTDRRLRREVVVWGKIDHPNVHSFLGYRSKPRPRLISPWCRHGNLKDYVLENPSLSRVDKLRLTYQAACGLDHLHSRTPPICHGDIKPQNVLIKDDLEAALSDFGLSRVLRDVGEPSELTSSEAVKGTLNYMANELLSEEEARPTLESDVYAFGGLILTVMSEKPPFHGLREPAIILRVMQDQPPKPEDHPDVPPCDPLWKLMRQCWKQTPASRPTIREVLRELWGCINPGELNPWSPRPHPAGFGGDPGGCSDLELDESLRFSPADGSRGLLKRSPKLGGSDNLYHQILFKAFNRLTSYPARQDILSRVLGTLVVAPHPVSLEVIATLYAKHEVFDETNQEDVISFLRRDIFTDLNPLLYIPASPSEPMRLIHTSIRDLLVDEHQCGQQPYYIDVVLHHRELASLCLNIMLESLRENICNLSNASKPSSEVQDIVQREVSKALEYCCRAWSIHLTEGIMWSKPGNDATPAELSYFELFSKGKIMCWLEVMSLIGATRDAILAAKHVHQWLLQRLTEIPKHDPLAVLWEDVRRFIIAFLEPISFGPLQIYISALPHCPLKTEIWKLYGQHTKVRILQGQRASTWPSYLWARSPNVGVNRVAFSPDGRVLAFGSSDSTIRFLDTQTGTAVGEPLTGHGSGVVSVCFSPDGKLLASGSVDNTIRLWDIQAGVPVGEPIVGHSARVNSVCFSPDGSLLVSGSEDKTVRLWNTETRMPVQDPFTGHSDSVSSVCFSPDGKLLASGSDDGTIRLWNTQTAGAAWGEQLAGQNGYVQSACFSPDGRILAFASNFHTIRLWDIGTRMPIRALPIEGFVFSFSFSPDGKILASASGTGIVRLWNPQTGAAVGEPLIGHTSGVRSVCFSPDGKLLASGSDDGSIRLWDLQAGTAVAGPLISYRGQVKSVCISPDGRYVASGSSDMTIRVWDSQTGAAVGRALTGHHSTVNSICFSPDGKLLASGSDDKTAQLWDPQVGVAVCKPLTGHTSWVLSVCFSPDGKLLASGSEDHSIRLWDPQTGFAVGKPLEGHSGRVKSVCFSPDGKFLASGSGDKTLRLWDPQTGATVGQPLKGCSSSAISVSFSPDGALLMAQCQDDTVANWDLTTRQRYDSPRTPSYSNPCFQRQWIKFHSSRFLWLPPQYWRTGHDGVALLGGSLFTFQNGCLSILDVSQVLGLTGHSS